MTIRVRGQISICLRHSIGRSLFPRLNIECFPILSNLHQRGISFLLNRKKTSPKFPSSPAWTSKYGCYAVWNLFILYVCVVVEGGPVVHIIGDKYCTAYNMNLSLIFKNCCNSLLVIKDCPDKKKKKTVQRHVCWWIGFSETSFSLENDFELDLLRQREGGYSGL